MIQKQTGALRSTIYGRLTLVGRTLYGTAFRAKLAAGLNISRSTLFEWMRGGGKRRDIDGELIHLIGCERDAADERLDRARRFEQAFQRCTAMSDSVDTVHFHDGAPWTDDDMMVLAKRYFSVDDPKKRPFDAMVTALGRSKAAIQSEISRRGMAARGAQLMPRSRVPRRTDVLLIHQRKQNLSAVL